VKLSDILFAVGFGALALGVIAVWLLSLWAFGLDAARRWSEGDLGWALGSVVMLALVAFWPPLLVASFLAKMGL
jgi:hypothetical protein